jgi:hypothetical protein
MVQAPAVWALECEADRRLELREEILAQIK